MCGGSRRKEAEEATVARGRGLGSPRQTWSQSGEEVRLEGEEAARVSRGWSPEAQALQGGPSEQAS